MAKMMTMRMKTTMMTPTGCVGHQLPKLVQVLGTPGPTAAQSETICEYQPNHGARLAPKFNRLNFVLLFSSVLKPTNAKVFLLDLMC